MIWHASPCMPSPRAEISNTAKQWTQQGVLARPKGFSKAGKKDPIIPRQMKICFFCLGLKKPGKASGSMVPTFTYIMSPRIGPAAYFIISFVLDFVFHQNLPK